MSALPDDVRKDPVCGMSVSARSQYRYENDGTEYSFCSARCRNRFIADPKTFLSSNKPQETVSSAASEQNLYTCPMHPEVESGISPMRCSAI
jgi:Cu+-exporting ATPase